MIIYTLWREKEAGFMAKEIFNRIEEKYMITRQQYEIMLEEFKKYMVPDEFSGGYSFHQVMNIYYDTKDNNLIRTSVTKPVYKEKIRLRSYGIPKGDSPVFLELKKKYHGVVNKRRSLMALEEAYAFLDTDELPPIKDYMNVQVLKELKYSIAHYEAVPKVCLCYERSALVAVENKDMRITFDRNIMARRDELRLEYGAFGERVVPKDTFIMEIKYIDRMPLWLIALLREHGLEKTSFSKYGTEYSNFIKYGIKEKKIYA